MKKKTPIYPPLALLKKTTARYPDIWRKLEFAHANNSVDNVSPWQCCKSFVAPLQKYFCHFGICY